MSTLRFPVAVALCVGALACSPALAQGEDPVEPAYSPFPAGAYSPAPPGAVVTFGPDGTFTVAIGEGAPLISGRYVATAEHVVITGEEGLIACTSPTDRTGIYGWASEGEGVVLRPVDDPCERRAGALSGGPMARVGE